MKDYAINFQVGDKTYPAIFNLNVMEEIQEEYGTIEAWGNLTDGKNGEVNAKALIFGMRAMINEAIDIESDKTGENKPLLTLKQVGRIISEAGLQKSAEALNKAVIDATKDDEQKNA